jgi:hypothetical protein
MAAMRNQLLILCSLALAATGCQEGDYCADTVSNATVTDVLHDTVSDRLIVGLYHSLSYCTGTDEKRFSNERIEVDLTTGEVFVDQRASNTRGPLDLPDRGYPLYTNGQFGSHHCVGCELVLRSQDQLYTFHFTTFGELEPVMGLEVFEQDVLRAAVDIGGYTSEPRPTP